MSWWAGSPSAGYSAVPLDSPRSPSILSSAARGRFSRLEACPWILFALAVGVLIGCVSMLIIHTVTDSSAISHQRFYTNMGTARGNSANDSPTSGQHISLQKVRQFVPDTVVRASGDSFSDLREYLPAADFPSNLCLFRPRARSASTPTSASSSTSPNDLHRRFAVITTIASLPTEAMTILMEQGWCVLVIGDTMSPPPADFLRDLPYSRQQQLVYFPTILQERLPYAILSNTPTRSFSRKNIGFLTAIHAGADVIFDVDDDNIFVPESSPTQSLPVRSKLATYRTTSHQLVQLHTEEHVHPVSHEPLYELDLTIGAISIQHSRVSPDALVVNPYPFFTRPTPADAASGTGGKNMKMIQPLSWPRGFPLEAVQESYHRWRDASLRNSTSTTCVPIVQQYLAGHDPDVDAIYRLTSEYSVPFDFMSVTQASVSSDDLHLVVPPARVLALQRAGNAPPSGGVLVNASTEDGARACH